MSVDLSKSGKLVLTEAERWHQYQICKQRGHVRGEPWGSNPPMSYVASKPCECKFCGTVYWTEAVVRESNAPEEPAE